jgi:hypothetical protein
VTNRIAIVFEAYIAQKLLALVFAFECNLLWEQPFLLLGFSIKRLFSTMYLYYAPNMIVGATFFAVLSAMKWCKKRRKWAKSRFILLYVLNMLDVACSS